MQEAQETRVRTLGQEGLLEEEMGSHSSILTGEIPWTEEPGMLCPWSLKLLSTHTCVCVCVCVCVYVNKS